MILAYSRRLAGSLGASSGLPRISAKPRIALSGVRSSWLTLASRRSFQALAISASARAALQAFLGGFGGADVAHDRHGRGAVDVGLEAARPQLHPTELGLALVRADPQAHGGGRRAVAARRLVERVEIGGSIADMDAIEEAATDEARRVVTKQRRFFAVGGKHAAAAIVAQHQVADRAGERRIALGAAGGRPPTGARGGAGSRIRMDESREATAHVGEGKLQFRLRGPSGQSLPRTNDLSRRLNQR